MEAFFQAKLIHLLVIRILVIIILFIKLVECLLRSVISIMIMNVSQLSKAREVWVKEIYFYDLF